MDAIIIIAICGIVWSLGVLVWIFYEYVDWNPESDKMIESEQKIWLEKEDKITITNVTMWFPKGMNPLAFLGFIGAEIHSSDVTQETDA